MFNSPAARAERFWLYYFNVADIDAAAKRVADGGGKIMHGPQQVPGGGWIVQAADPHGAESIGARRCRDQRPAVLPGSPDSGRDTFVGDDQRAVQGPRIIGS